MCGRFAVSCRGRDSDSNKASFKDAVSNIIFKNANDENVAD